MFYHPSAFYLYLARGVSTPTGDAYATEFHRFAHEYAHLIQDRTTLFGVSRFSHLINELHDLSRLIEEEGQTIQLPLSEAAGVFADQLRAVQAMKGATNPRTSWPTNEDGKVRNWAHVTHHVKTRHIHWAGDDYDLPYVEVDLVDNVSGEELTQEIGPREICEGYSVAVQVIKGGPEASPAEFEYIAIERILSTIGQVCPRQMVVICHWALQDISPARRFTEILELLRQKDAIPAAEELYDELRREAIKGGLAARIEQIIAEFDVVVQTQFQAGEGDFLYAVYSWYQKHAAHALRRNLDLSRRYPLDTFLCDPVEGFDGERFEALVREEPVPYVETGEGVFFSLGLEEDALDVVAVDFLRAIRDLHNKLWFGNSENWACPFVRDCVAGHKDEECEREPWRKSVHRPPCAYGAASHYLGLGVSSVFKTR